MNNAKSWNRKHNDTRMYENLHMCMTKTVPVTLWVSV